MNREEAKKEMSNKSDGVWISLGSAKLTIDRIYDITESRTCESCNYWTKGNFWGNCKKEVNQTKNQEESLTGIDFGCNKWEPKQ